LESARASRAGDRALAIANFVAITQTLNTQLSTG